MVKAGTSHRRIDEDAVVTVKTGMAAPTEKAMADHKAACMGWAHNSEVIPDLISGMGFQCVVLHQLTRHFNGKGLFQSSFLVDGCELQLFLFPIAF